MVSTNRSRVQDMHAIHSGAAAKLMGSGKEILAENHPGAAANILGDVIGEAQASIEALK